MASSKSLPPAGPAPLSANARTVLEKRYLVKDAEGKPTETPETMFWRVATTIAEADRRYGASDAAVQTMSEEFYRLMTERRFEPNSPTLMNAGRPLGQLSACFVLGVADALSNGKDGIYDTLKSMALIHQSGGGCVAGDARVWTTFCGVEPIEVLFNRATIDGRVGVAHGSGVAYDVSDLGIRTASMDPSSGHTGLKPVTHVWRFDVPAERQIVVHTREGTEVQTSEWHPFMVVRGTRLEEVRADALLGGDVILGPERPDCYWPWDECRTVAGLEVNADLAWLIGFTLGDGSFGYVPALRQHRLRWFSGSTDVLERVQRILASHGINVSIQQDPRGGLLLATLTQDFVHAMRQACALPGNGPKDATIRVPEHMGKAPLSVVRAFVAGLMDSDGTVDTDDSPSYTTASPEMAQDLAGLLSLLGYQPSVRRREPRGNGKLPTYTVLVCPLPQVNEFASDIAPFMSCEQRKSRLQSDASKQRALRLPFGAWRDELARHGLIGTRATGPGPVAYEMDHWSCNEQGRVNRSALAAIADALEPFAGERAALLRRMARSGQEIERVEHAATAKPYYDLTVEDWNTYAAGRNGLVMIHNTGFSFSRLRPKGSMVRSTTGVASGPVSFMKLYDASTEAVKQGGTRRGANMGILRVDHPDILEFITSKEDITQITNFNISVAVTDEFMAAVKASKSYDLKDPHTGAVVGQLDASVVWDKMIEGAWRTGEPGCFFIDEANRYNPVPQVGSYEATNPCGEQMLLPYDVCNLGSINVGYYVRDAKMDWDAFRRDIHLSTHFLDNVIDANRFPLTEIDVLSKRIRRIGLGVMGFADALVRLGIAYDSPEGVEFGRKVMAFLDLESKRESERLAHERGAFPEWARSIWGPDDTCARDAAGRRMRPMQLLRNCNATTVAPTGTISIIAGCSSGLEPLFAVAFMRNQAGVMMPDVNEDFVAVAKREGWYSDQLMERIAREGRIDFPEVPVKWQRVFVTANVIKPEWHVRMQAAFQEHCDSGISKTTNFAHTASVADVRAIYELAYQLKCKGVTVYRDGSRDNQVLSTGATEKAKSEREKGGATAAAPAGEKREIAELRGTLAERDAEIERLKKALFEAEAENLQRRAKRSRPDKLRGTTARYETPLGTMFANITEDDRGQPFEVFINLGKAGGSAMADAEAMGRLISLALRSGIPLMEIHRQLRGIASDRVVGLGPKKILSVPDAIGMALEDWWRDHTQGVQQDLLGDTTSKSAPPTRETPVAAASTPGTTPGSPAPNGAASPQGIPDRYADATESFIGTCPDCGSQLEFAEGCVKCHVCGFSECG
jgi:ribonucleoside-diphosphate reductase alpha chain